MSDPFAGAFAMPCAGAARYLLNDEGWRAMAAAPGLRFVAMWADESAVIALLRDAAGAKLMATVAVEQGFFPGVSPWRPEAAEFERMIRDLWGYNAVGGIDGRPLLDFGQWRLAHPLGRPVAPFAAPEPATSGFAHKGTLALMRGKPPRVAARFAARVDGGATVAHSIAFARAAEAAGRSRVPPRAEQLREMMMRLEAVGGALECIGRVAVAAEAALLGGRVAVLREAVARTAAAAFGHRLMMDAVVPGGVVADLLADGPGALLWLRRSVAAADLPALLEASLGRRLRDLPAVGARMALALETVAAGLEGLGMLVEQLEDGPVIQAAMAVAGEGIGEATGPSGDILHWLRLEGGQIAGVFMLDPGWVQAGAAAAEAAAADASDAEIVLAAHGILASGMEL